MPHTKDELIKMINLDEPDYAEIMAKLTNDDIPLLNELAQDENPAIATKAISCLAYMNDDRAYAGIEKATKSSNPVLRVAATHAIRNMSNKAGAEKLIDKMLDDTDFGVKKFALKTVEASKMTNLKEKVKQMNLRDSSEHIRTLSKQVMEKL